MWIGFIWLKIGPVASSYEHGDEPSGSIKGGGISWLAETPLASREFHSVELCCAKSNGRRISNVEVGKMWRVSVRGNPPLPLEGTVWNYRTRNCLTPLRIERRAFRIQSKEVCESLNCFLTLCKLSRHQTFSTWHVTGQKVNTSFKMMI
jgi:hypothetical protein